MPNGTVPAFPVNTYVLVNVIDYDDNGTTPDTTESLAITNNTPAIVRAVVNPGNPRQVKITGLAAGSASVSVSAPGVPPLNVLNLAVTVSAAPNLSRIDMGTIEGPFPV